MNIKFNINSNDNTLFVTSRCDNRCVMCAQPPNSIDDIDELMERNLKILKEAPEGLTDIGITGGEPTLLREKLLFLVQKIAARFPDANIHILTNGRAFEDPIFTRSFVPFPQILFGIPLHSDIPTEHDLITQVNNSYYQTMRGFYQLASINARIELRVVINKLNYMRLPHMADFIWRNLPFVSYISLMGLEDIGYARKNRKQIWIDPTTYSQELEKAVFSLHEWDMNVSIFNIPLCLLPQSLHSFARRSISDWKVKYLDCCNQCSKKIECCGLFATSEKQSSHITPFVQ